MNKKTAVLIPGTTGLYKGIYRLARRLKSETVTVNFNKIKSLVVQNLVERVIIIEGSDKQTVPTIYKELKEINNTIKYILVDSWNWPVRKFDRMIILPGKNSEQLIEQILK